jgi:hypothetical protein
MVAGLILSKWARTAPDGYQKVHLRPQQGRCELATGPPEEIPDRFERLKVPRRVHRLAGPLFALFGFPRLERYPPAVNPGKVHFFPVRQNMQGIFSAISGIPDKLVEDLCFALPFGRAVPLCGPVRKGLSGLHV